MASYAWFRDRWRREIREELAPCPNRLKSTQPLSRSGRPPKARVRVRSASRKASSRASSQAHREKLEADNVPERKVFAAVLFDIFVSRLADGSPGAIHIAKDIMRELSKNYDRKATFGRLQGMVAREKAKRQRSAVDTLA